MKHRLDPSSKEKVVAVISAFLGNDRPEIATAYIFGSFVESGLFSDIDLGILTEGAVEKPLDYELEMETQLEKRVKYPVDVRIINQAPLSFTQNVIRHGRIILERNVALRVEFTGYILKRYFDFAPFRRLYLGEVTNAPI
jgi:predicted nucleotidyltransferase